MTSAASRLAVVRRIGLGAAVLVVVLILVSVFVGGAVPGMILVPAGGVAVGALIAGWIAASAERRAAEVNRAEGRSWRPDRDGL